MYGQHYQPPLPPYPVLPMPAASAARQPPLPPPPPQQQHPQQHYYAHQQYQHYYAQRHSYAQQYYYGQHQQLQPHSGRQPQQQQPPPNVFVSSQQQQQPPQSQPPPPPPPPPPAIDTMEQDQFSMELMKCAKCMVVKERDSGYGKKHKKKVQGGVCKSCCAEIVAAEMKVARKKASLAQMKAAKKASIARTASEEVSSVVLDLCAKCKVAQMLFRRTGICKSCWDIDNAARKAAKKAARKADRRAARNRKRCAGCNITTTIDDFTKAQRNEEEGVCKSCWGKAIAARVSFRGKTTASVNAPKTCVGCSSVKKLRDFFSSDRHKEGSVCMDCWSNMTTSKRPKDEDPFLARPMTAKRLRELGDDESTAQSITGNTTLVSSSAGGAASMSQNAKNVEPATYSALKSCRTASILREHAAAIDTGIQDKPCAERACRTKRVVFCSNLKRRVLSSLGGQRDEVVELPVMLDQRISKPLECEGCLSGTWNDLAERFSSGALAYLSASDLDNQRTTVKDAINETALKIGPEPCQELCDLEMKSQLFKIHADACRIVQKARSLKNWTHFQIEVVKITEIGLSTNVQVNSESLLRTEVSRFHETGMRPKLPVPLSTEPFSSEIWYKSADVQLNHNSVTTQGRGIELTFHLISDGIQRMLGIAKIPLADIHKSVPPGDADKWTELSFDAKSKGVLLAASVLVKVRRSPVTKSFIEGKRKDAKQRLAKLIAWIKKFRENDVAFWNATFGDSAVVRGDVKGSDAVSLLHAAVYLKDSSLVHKLIELGFNPIANSVVGSPLMLAKNMSDGGVSDVDNNSIEEDDQTHKVSGVLESIVKELCSATEAIGQDALADKANDNSVSNGAVKGQAPKLTLLANQKPV